MGSPIMTKAGPKNMQRDSGIRHKLKNYP